MAIGYSYDLRIRAVNLVNSGKKVKKVSKILDIGETAIYRWVKYFKQNIDLSPKKNWQKGHSCKITDLEKFRKFVDENNHLTEKELAEKWGGVRRSTVHRALVKINYSKKKDLWLCGERRSKEKNF